MIPRRLTSSVQDLLSRHPVVALLGPRQAGKTTLALQIAETRPSVYLDLESRPDAAKLTEPELFLSGHRDKLVILDEIQRVPELFPVLRGLIDARRREGSGAGHFLVLGSASVDLLRQSAESLAGRIVYAELSPLDLLETGEGKGEDLWLRGGFPRSLLAASDAHSLEWRRAFIQTYLERDIPQLGPRLPAELLRRFWTMLAHEQGAMLNAARLATGLGVSGQTVGRYLDLLCDLFLARRLPPWTGDTAKRLVRSPKVYVRDSGLVHALLELSGRDQVLAHPVVGGSWEGHVLETLLAVAPPGTQPSFYRTSAGAEVDLVLRFPGPRTWAIEIKRSLVPTPSRGFHHGCAEIKPDERWVAYPGRDRFAVGEGVQAIGISDLAERVRDQAIG